MTEIDKERDPELASAALEGALGELLLDLWRRTRIDWSFASDRLSEAFRRHRELGSRERRFVAETLYGLVRQLRRVDEALALGGVRAVDAAPDRARLCAYLLLEEGLPVEDALRHQPGVDWRAVAAVDEALDRIADPVARLARRRSLPDWLARALRDEVGDEADPLAAALNQRAPMTVRVNALRADRQAVADELAAAGFATEPGRWSPTALHVRTRTNLFALDAFRAGRFEAQDEGSQLIADLVVPPPKSLVVDYCAGAGGKTLALAAHMGNKGRLLAADIDGRKLAELRRRARRAGVDNATALELGAAADAAFPAQMEPCVGRSKRVLVDAPCTGVGALRRNPEARWRLTPADLQRLPAEQLAIAERALDLVGPGGRLVYATCSILGPENEAVVGELLARHPELVVVPIREIWGADRAAPLEDASGRFLKTLPHRHGTDGFFAAVIRRPRS